VNTEFPKLEKIDFSNWEVEIFEAQNALEKSIRDLELEAKTLQKLSDIVKLTSGNPEREIAEFLRNHLVCGDKYKKEFYQKFFQEALEKIWKYLYWLKDELLILVLDVEGLSVPLGTYRLIVFLGNLFRNKKEAFQLIYHEFAHVVLEHNHSTFENEEEANFLAEKWSCEQ